MDAIVDLARKSPQDADFQTKLTEQLTKAGKKLAGNVDRVLNDAVLNPVQHGVACAELLAYKLHSNGPVDTKAAPELLEQTRAVFYQMPSSAVACTGKALSYISRQATRAALASDRGMRLIGPLKALVDKIAAVDVSLVTGAHVDLLLLTLKYHAYDLISDCTFLRGGAALSSVAPSAWTIDITDYLQFWYYLGNYHAARKSFVGATEAYYMVLTAPSQNGAVSAIQLEAYKKQILVSLLAHGEVPASNPRLTTPPTQRALDGLAGSYLDLAKAYRKAASSTSVAGQSVTGEISHLVEANAEVFLHDKNLGLIKQILKSLVRKQISKLTQTYITFGLADIAAQVNLASAAAQPPQPPAQLAERYVFDMICASDVFAKLNSKAGMVQFLEDPEEYDTTSFIDGMDRRIRDVAALSDKLAEVEMQLQLTPAYILKSGMLGGRGAGGAGGADDIALATALSLSAGGGGRGGYEDDDMAAAMAASLAQQ